MRTTILMLCAAMTLFGGSNKSGKGRPPNNDQPVTVGDASTIPIELKKRHPGGSRTAEPDPTAPGVYVTHEKHPLQGNASGKIVIPLEQGYTPACFEGPAGGQYFQKDLAHWTLTLSTNSTKALTLRWDSKGSEIRIETSDVQPGQSTSKGKLYFEGHVPDKVQLDVDGMVFTTKPAKSDGGPTWYGTIHTCPAGGCVTDPCK